MDQHPIIDQLKKQITQLQKNAQKNSTYIRTGDVRKVARSINRMATEVPIDERLRLVTTLYQMDDYQCRLCATHLLNISAEEIQERHLPVIARYVKSFTSWGQVDDFGTSVLQALLQQLPDKILPLLSQWNASPSMWERRMSMVAFTRKIGESGLYVSECLSLAENLLNDPEDLVQKAVGWALKDTLRGDRERTLAYIKDLRKRGVSAVITLYAIRDLHGKERDEILALRAKAKKTVPTN